MPGNITVFEIVRPFMFWSSPLIFLFGVILVLYSNYRKLEEFLGQEIGGVKKRVVLAIETNIYVFHEWLLERRTLTGIGLYNFFHTFFLRIQKLVKLKDPYSPKYPPRDPNLITNILRFILD